MDTSVHSVAHGGMRWESLFGAFVAQRPSPSALKAMSKSLPPTPTAVPHAHPEPEPPTPMVGMQPAPFDDNDLPPMIQPSASDGCDETPSSGIAAALEALSRPKAFRVKNKQMVAFVADPRLLRIIDCPRPISVQLSGGIVAMDVVAALIRHVRAAYGDALEARNAWLNPRHFQVVCANPDGTPDEDFRVVWTDERVVDSEYVLVVPRPECSNRAFLSLKRTGAHRGCDGPVKLSVGVTFQQDESYHVMHVAVLGDLTLDQLSEAVCKQLFTRASVAPADIEAQSLCVEISGESIPVSLSLSQSPFEVAMAQMTVRQIAAVGVDMFTLTTSEQPPRDVADDGQRISVSNQSISGQGSFVENPSGAMDDLWRVQHMDDVEAMAYRTFNVWKRNERKVWQQRMFAVDKDFIYNQHPNESSSTKRPVRRIVDVEAIRINKADPKCCEVDYVKNTANVLRDDLEFATPKECKYFATKVRILQRMAQQSAALPSPTHSGSPSPQKKGTVSQRFFNFFK